MGEFSWGESFRGGNFPSVGFFRGGGGGRGGFRGEVFREEEFSVGKFSGGQSSPLTFHGGGGTF